MAYAGDLVAPVAFLAGLGLLSTLVHVFTRVRLTALSVLLLGGAYVLVEVAGRVNTLSLIGYAAGMVVLAEVLLWGAGLPSRARVDSAVFTRWLRGLALIVAAAAAFALLVLVAAGFSIPGALPGALAGAGATAVVLAVPWLLLRKKPSEERSGRKG